MYILKQGCPRQKKKKKVGGQADAEQFISLPGLLLGVFHDVDGLVGNLGELVAVGLLELFQDDGGFVAIRCSEGEELDALSGDETGWFGHFDFFVLWLTRAVV